MKRWLLSCMALVAGCAPRGVPQVTGETVICLTFDRGCFVDGESMNGATLRECLKAQAALEPAKQPMSIRFDVSPYVPFGRVILLAYLARKGGMRSEFAMSLSGKARSYPLRFDFRGPGYGSWGIGQDEAGEFMVVGGEVIVAVGDADSIVDWARETLRFDPGDTERDPARVMFFDEIPCGLVVRIFQAAETNGVAIDISTSDDMKIEPKKED